MQSGSSQSDGTQSVSPCLVSATSRQVAFSSVSLVVSRLLVASGLCESRDLAHMRLEPVTRHFTTIMPSESRHVVVAPLVARLLEVRTSMLAGATVVCLTLRAARHATLRFDLHLARSTHPPDGPCAHKVDQERRELLFMQMLSKKVDERVQGACRADRPDVAGVTSAEITVSAHALPTSMHQSTSVSLGTLRTGHLSLEWMCSDDRLQQLASAATLKPTNMQHQPTSPPPPPPPRISDPPIMVAPSFQHVALRAPGVSGGLTCRARAAPLIRPSVTRPAASSVRPSDHRRDQTAITGWSTPPPHDRPVSDDIVMGASETRKRRRTMPTSAHLGVSTTHHVHGPIGTSDVTLARPGADCARVHPSLLTGVMTAAGVSCVASSGLTASRPSALYPLAHHVRRTLEDDPFHVFRPNGAEFKGRMTTSDIAGR